MNDPTIAQRAAMQAAQEYVEDLERMGFSLELTGDSSIGFVRRSESEAYCVVRQTYGSQWRVMRRTYHRGSWGTRWVAGLEGAPSGTLINDPRCLLFASPVLGAVHGDLCDWGRS